MAATVENGLLEAANQYAELGYKVFPCKPDGKIPAIPKQAGGKGVLNATDNPDQVESWWTRWPTANIGLSCAGLLIVDIDPDGIGWPHDPEKALDLAGCPSQTTPRGGTHHIFRKPAGKPWRCSASKLAKGVDVRTDGGYIVASPSVVNGKPYAWISGSELSDQMGSLPEPPGWLCKALDAIDGPTTEGPQPTARTGNGGAIPSGQRNTTLAAMAGSMRRAGFSANEIVAAIAEVNQQRCQPPLSDDEVRRVGESIGRYEPGAVYETPSKPGKKRGFVDVDNIVPWKPFPVEVLPEPVQPYVRGVAAAVGCDPSYVAVAMLPALASAIGNTRQIRLKRSWFEPAVLWGAIVGDSGTTKSPAIDAATGPVKRRQARAIEEYRVAKETYDADVEEYKLALDDWKKSGRKKGDPKPEEPTEPVCRRLYCSDVTVEALADRLSDNPRGMLLVRDELAGWLRSFDQYKGGRGADAPHWLTMHGARDLVVDRKTADKKMIFVPRAAVSICGGIQPEILARALGQEHIVDGLLARLLVTMPPRRRKRWTEADINEQLEQRVDDLLGRLYALEPDIDENEQPVPITVGMTSGGKTAWVRFYDEHAAEQVEAVGERAAVLSKIEGAAARLALIIHLARCAADDPTLVDPDRVDEASINAGVTLARWFSCEAERVSMVLHETDEDRERRQIVELIQQKGGRITPRELRQGMRRFKNSGEEAEQALDELAKAGVGTWETADPHRKGGRPSRVFRLSTPSTVYETPSKPAKNGGFVDRHEDADEINAVFSGAADADAEEH